MALNIIQLETALLLREKMMYPKNEEEFFKYISILDNETLNIERILKMNSSNIFTIKEYYIKNKDFIQEVIDNVI